MPTTLKPAVACAHGNSLHTDLQPRRPRTVVRVSTRPSITRTAIRYAMDQTDTSQKAFAINASIAESVLSDALNGRGRHFEADWIMLQGNPFVCAFWQSIEVQLGLRAESRRAQRMARMRELVNLTLDDLAEELA